MRVVSADHRPELDLAVVVDPDADPVDWDLVVAKFLLAVVRKRSRSSPGSPAEADGFSEAPLHLRRSVAEIDRKGTE